MEHDNIDEVKISNPEELARNGWLNGFIGIVIFSGSLPATRIAVLDFNPIFLTVFRASIAGVLALIALMTFREKRPERKHLIPLASVAFGVVVGFPLLTALALRHITSAHSIVFSGLLPMATATFGFFRGGERPKPMFWLFSFVGSLLVVGYAVSQGLQASLVGDLLMLAAIILCGFGYAEGGKLSKTLGGWQVISWALLLSMPVMLPLVAFYWPTSIEGIRVEAWISLAYVSLFSMFIGFLFWYKGLSQGGIVAVSQLQLLQPFLGLALAATLLHERVSIGMFVVTLGVVLCVFGTKRFAK